ncbi:hypothetical protein SAMN05880582_101129 [Rhizobium sp. RU20A]|uniref:hypothetical protein n=1 Tax=Rhizobium sp. RU20A TaxID=1907412 RepID=UPI0009559941|nr:hypothetical protein [Rhizobium sp. RU20A]SIP94860.1 hypothetical protein SAMN05880582_101129 [Rhizobium sp. RU20A]
MKLSGSSRFLLSSAAALAFASPAFALDGADLVAKLNAAYATSGATIAYDQVSVDGSTVTMEGTKLVISGPESKSINIGEVTMEGVEEQDDGGYYVETVALPDVDMKEADNSFSVRDMQIGGLTIPGNPNGGTIDDMLVYETASTGPLVVTAKGKEVFSMESSEANMTALEDGKGFDFDADLKTIKADLSQVDDAKTKDALEKLGLMQVNGDIAMKGSWQVESGDMKLDQFTFDFANVGKLNLAFDISGYTLQFVKAMQDAAKAAEANPNKEQANQAMGLAMMGLMQQLTFKSAEIRFEDASITKRALDYVGGQQGVPGDQFAQSLKAMVPIMMAQLNVPELQNQVSAAVNTYLDNPKSLTIRATPANPVPVPMIAGAAMGAPNTLPQVLGVTVTAND